MRPLDRRLRQARALIAGSSLAFAASTCAAPTPQAAPIASNQAAVPSCPTGAEPIDRAARQLRIRGRRRCRTDGSPPRRRNRARHKVRAIRASGRRDRPRGREDRACRRSARDRPGTFRRAASRTAFPNARPARRLHRALLGFLARKIQHRARRVRPWLQRASARRNPARRCR